MALIKCPECGKEVSDKAPACPNCGCPIQTVELPKSVAPETSEEKPKKKTKAAFISVIATIAVLGALCGAYFMFFSPGAKLRATYSKATDLYNAGNYAEALPMYESLGEYSNSADAAVWCRYELAKEAVSHGHYETAKEYLEGVDYLESAMLSKQCDYQLGIQAMEAHDWETAAAFFEDLDYENSEKMLTDCSFMIDLRDSVIRRMEINAKEKSDLRTLVNTELAYLQSYKEASFFDKNISNQAKKYLAGLDKQLKSFDKEFEYEYQIAWQEGLVKRYEALDNLYQKYDFLKDNKDFVGTYIAQLSNNRDILNGYYAIEEDLDRQYEDESVYQKSGNTYILSLKNNTDYTFSSTWEWTVYDRNGAKIQTTPVTVNDIKPGQSYEVRFTYSGSFGDLRMTNYYGEIKKGS